MAAFLRGRRVRPLLATLLLVVVTIAVYGRSRTFGLLADDYSWIDGAHNFDARRAWDIEGRTHFYRPLIEIYFRGAVAVCGNSAECFHVLSISAHVVTSVLVGGLAASLSGVWGIGVLAGFLFAVQPAPVEAVTWVSAVTEILAATWFTLTIWLYRMAEVTRRRWPYGMSLVTFCAALLTHESSVVLLPVLVLSGWLVPSATDPASAELPRIATRSRSRLLDLAPFAGLLAAYGFVAYLINSQNPLVVEREYELGGHMLRNLLHALASFTVAERDVVTLAVLGIALLVAALMGPGRVRFFALWIVLTLLPFLPFRVDLSSRYFYLAAVGVAGLLAEALWLARRPLHRWAPAGVVLWWVLAFGITARFAVFAERNVWVPDHVRVPYEEYIAEVRARHPNPPRGATLEVPPGPSIITPAVVEPLVRWIYDDYTLRVRIAEGPASDPAKHMASPDAGPPH